MIRAVLFDLGGTLHTSTVPKGRDVWFATLLQQRLADYGIRLKTSPELLAKQLYDNSECYKHHSEESLVELPASTIWSRYFLREYGLSEQRLAPMAEELSFLYDYMRPCVIRRPYLQDTFKTLHEMHIKTGVISNIISQSVVPHFLAEYDLTQYMSCVITSSAAGIRKPSAEIFRMAERKLGLLPEELAYVGDTISRDVIGTRNAGWRLMIQIENPGIAHRDVSVAGLGYKPDYRVRELLEIPAIIEKENEKRWSAV